MRYPAALLTSALIVLAGCSRKDHGPPPLNPRPGSLEYCIVANDVDDEEAISAAQGYFTAAAKDPAKQAELKKLAEDGKAPPAPKANSAYKFKFNGHDTTFRWVELDPNLIDELKLDDRKGVKREQLDALAEARRSGEVAVLSLDLLSKNRVAIWNRPCVSSALDEAARKAKTVDYFVLIREPERGKELTEAHLAELETTSDTMFNRPAIAVKLNEEGTRRLRELTRENIPARDGDPQRQLAIIIAGRVFSAPYLRGEVGDRFQIGARFTEESVKEVIGRIRPTGQ
jgi:hypothetical protein